MPSRHLLLLVAVAAACGGPGGDKGSPAPAPAAAPAGQPTLATDDDKVLYAIGLALGRQLSGLGLTEPDVQKVQAGIGDSVLNRPKQVELDAMMPKVQEYAQRKAAAAAETEKKSSGEFLAKAAAEPGATKTASGLIIVHVKQGDGAQPKADDKVKVHYTGKLTDGTVFDSSVQRGEPAVFPLNGVIKCWTEGVGLMKVGGKAKLTCPSDIAYGDQGSPPKIKPGATLVFDVELLEIVK